MMDNAAIRACEDATHAGYPKDAGAALIVELDGPEGECATRFDDVIAICEKNDATDIRVAEDEAERALIWKARRAAFAAMGRLAPNYYVQDGVIPRTRLPEALGRKPPSPHLLRRHQGRRGRASRGSRGPHHRSVR